MPQGGAEQRSSRALVTIDVLDVNDNAPSFEQESYTAVIPENAPVGISVVNVTATDPDEDEGGIIQFDIIDEGEANGINKNVNSITRVLCQSFFRYKKARGD